MTQSTVAIVQDALVSPAELLQTPDGMRRWLDQQPAAAIVGESESVLRCPIACYLAACGVDGPAVGPQVIRWEYDPQRLAFEQDAPRCLLPDWAADFVRALDVGPSRFVTAAHARALLHQVSGAVA